MKILTLADATSIHIHKWARYFAGRGHKVEILSFRPARLDFAQVHHIDTGVYLPEGGNWHYLLGLRAARLHILRMAPDVIFCHYLTSYGLIGALLKSAIPLVIWLHGTDILIKPGRSLLYRMMARYALARSDLIIMAAAHMKQHVQRLVGVGKRSIVVPIGVDLQEFNQTGPLEQKELACISNRVFKKNSNVDLILEAIAIARETQPGIHLTIVGDGPLRPDLETMVRRLDLEPWVAFLGEVPNEEMPDLLHKHPLYISVTTSDGTSSSLLEAMACGSFPLVSDIPANQSLISNGVNGFLVSLRRADLISQRILKAFESPQLIKNARRINWEIVKERGDYLVNMERVQHAIEQLLDDKRMIHVET